MNSTNTNEMMLDKASQKPKTMVLWDINTCPVPDGCDPRMVGQSIEWALKKAGKSGPLTITAMGNLTHTLKENPDILPAISSTGILLKHIRGGIRDIYEELLRWMRENPSPANLMLITGDAKEVKCLTYALSNFGKVDGYTLFQVYHQADFNLVNSEETTTQSLMFSRKCIWERLLKDAKDSGDTRRHALEENFCETGDSPCSFSCRLCKFAAQTYEDFITHLNGRVHLARELDFVEGPPPKRKLVKEIFTISKYINKQRKKELNLRFEEDRRRL